MKYTFKNILLATALIGFVSSCIKEDRSECNPGVLLKYDYSLNTEHKNLFGKEVGKVTVYVFDANELYYGTYSDQGKHLTNDYQLLLPLPVGHYTAVTWGGDLNTYSVGEVNSDGTVFRSGLKEGVTHIDDFMLTAEKDGQSITELSDLYHGKTKITSVYWPSEATTVNLMKNTKHLNVTIQDVTIKENGILRAKVPNPYTVVCKGTNGRYTTDNSFGKKANELTYQPYQTHVESGKMTADLRLLRLMIGNAFRLHIKNAMGETVFDRDLIEAMMDTEKFKTQEDFDREGEYNVVVRMDKDLVVSVTINGWEVVEIEPNW